MIKANARPYTGKWQGIKMTLAYREWCEVIGIRECNFHFMLHEFDSFQDMLNSKQPVCWKEKLYFLYKHRPTNERNKQNNRALFSDKARHGHRCC